jgi:exodeoxyribonuclease VII small subunit
MKTPKSYKEALEKLEQIIASIEYNETPLEELTEKIKEAKSLLKFCEEALEKVQTSVEEK